MDDEAIQLKKLEHRLIGGDATVEPVMLLFDVLKRITNDFHEVIGEGGFGVVYKGVVGNREVAVKKLLRTDEFSEKQFQDEVTCLTRVQHKNIVKFLGYCSTTHQKLVPLRGEYVWADVRQRFLCFEYVPNKSLHDYLRDESRGRDWNTRIGLIKGICQGLDYLHNKERINHLDLKPENILLDTSLVPKITDFGLSRRFGVDQSRMVTKNVFGTRGFTAPEFLDGGLISFKSDIYSLGIIIIKILRGSNDVPNLKNWHESLDFDGPQVQSCIEIARACVDPSEGKRPKVGDIVDTLNAMEGIVEESPFQGVQVLALTSSSVKPSSLPVLDKLPGSSSGRGPLDVVIVYAFDCTDSTPAWSTVGDVYGLVEEKLAHFVDSCIGYIYVMLTPNTYTSDMKFVESAETKATGNTGSARRRLACTKNMASGLPEAHKMISNRGYNNGIILFFSDGLINKGDFFDGTENFISKVPVHTFTVGGDAYNHVLHAIAANSPGGKFHNVPIPERPNLSAPFSKLLDSIIGGTTLDLEMPPRASSAREPVDVVIVYAFDCTDSTQAWYTVGDVYGLVEEKLAHFVNSCIGYIYVMLTPNTYTSDMKLVESAETKATGNTGSARRRLACMKNMASGLPEAHKMISNRGYNNGIILFFSDGLINKGDFFDGTENFISKVPVHTFTVGGDAYNHGLHAIAANSPGGKFHTVPVPERPNLSAPFSKLLDSIIGGTTLDLEMPPFASSAREPVDVVIVYAFDCTDSTQAWYTVGDVYGLVEEKLAHFVDSCIGYIYVMLTPNTYTSDMKLVESAETKATGNTGSARRRLACTKNMASGLPEAHKMISNRGYNNGIILFFSDGLINKGDFFDGTENFISKVPVHTFTVGGDAYNHGLQAIAANSPGGTFYPLPVPERPQLSAPFSELLESLLRGTTTD